MAWMKSRAKTARHGTRKPTMRIATDYDRARRLTVHDDYPTSRPAIPTSIFPRDSLFPGERRGAISRRLRTRQRREIDMADVAITNCETRDRVIAIDYAHVDPVRLSRSTITRRLVRHSRRILFHATHYFSAKSAGRSRFGFERRETDMAVASNAEG